MRIAIKDFRLSGAIKCLIGLRQHGRAEALLKESKPSRVTALAVLTSFCAHILSLAIPLALLQTYDRILPNQAYGTTVVLAVGVCLAVVLEAILRYGTVILFANIGALFEKRMRVKLVAHILKGNAKDIHACGAPTLTESLRTVSQLRDFWSGNTKTALHELPFLVIYIALIAYIAGWLALVPLCLTLIALIAALGLLLAIEKAVRDVALAENERRELIWGIFSGLIEAKVLAAETCLTRKYRDVLAKSMEASSRMENYLMLVRENGSLLAQISTIILVSFGAFMVVNGSLTTGGLAACTLLAGRSIAPAMGAFSYLGQLSGRRKSLQKVNSILNIPEAPLWREAQGAKDFQGGSILLEGACLSKGSVTVPQGHTVLVSASDSLLATGFLEALIGIDNSLPLSITLNGEQRAYYTASSLRHNLVMASAHTPLIKGTLLDNLTLFSPQYEEAALKLMRALGLDSFVDGLRQGLVTPIGSMGAEVTSPGIAIRIGLIRALIRHPKVLCLDEIGGALDFDGIKRLLGVLNEIKGNTTVFLVSGNPSISAIADMMISVCKGEGNG